MWSVLSKNQREDKRLTATTAANGLKHPGGTMEDEREELKEIKALVLTLATALTGLLTVFKKIFQTMAVAFFALMLGWLAALAWLVFSKAV